VPVRAVLCFVDGDWPLLGRLEVRGVPIIPPRDAANLARANGPLEQSEVEHLAGELASRLPPA
jgi:hypothetical protein